MGDQSSLDNELKLTSVYGSFTLEETSHPLQVCVLHYRDLCDKVNSFCTATGHQCYMSQLYDSCYVWNQYSHVTNLLQEKIIMMIGHS